jgi:hypothetical protein
MSGRVGLYLFLGLVVLDGAVRKWLLPGSEQLVYIAKDILLLALMARYVMQRGLQYPLGLPSSGLTGWLAAYVVIAGLQALNPSLPSLLLGAVGLKSHVLYVALLFLVPAAFRDTEDVARAFRYLLIPIVLVLAFGVLQFSLPVDHPLNRYVRGTTWEIATFGFLHRVRVTSTFSYVSGMTVFVFFALCLALGLLAAGRWRFASNKLAYACLLAALVVAPMTGARWVYYMLLLALPLFLYGMVRTGMLQGGYALRIVVFASLTMGAISLWSMQALESFEQRRQSATDFGARVESLVLKPLRFATDAGLLGFGAGATHQAAPALVPQAGYYGWLPTLDFEDEPGRLMLELGVLGFVVSLGLRIYLCWLAWQAMLAGGTPREKALAGAALMYFVAHVTSPIVFNGTGGALYWLFAGILAVILRDQYVRRATVQPALPPGAVLMARAPR